MVQDIRTEIFACDLQASKYYTNRLGDFSKWKLSLL
jgi:hypothetical protein